MRQTLSLFALILPATLALAHEGVQNPAVQARMDVMGLIAAETKVIGEMAKGAVPFNAARAQAAALAIATHTAAVPDLFAAPEQDPKSEALSAIWEDFADFTRKNDALADAARVASGLETEADLKAALVALGETCAACHRLYRE